jgi:hypothetical protein
VTSTMYEFRVDGRLPEHGGEILVDMQIEEIPPGLLLRTAVVDEAHLHGIIAQLLTLGLTVVSARPVSP